MAEILGLSRNTIKHALLDISVKIADAVEIMDDTKIMIGDLRDVLIKAHLELETLYINLDGQLNNNK